MPCGNKLVGCESVPSGRTWKICAGSSLANKEVRVASFRSERPGSVPHHIIGGKLWGVNVRYRHLDVGGKRENRADLL
jgi:hypothetical protein